MPHTPSPPVNGRYRPVDPVQLTHPAWCRTASIYQLNTRQLTQEGTLRAAEAHLERIRDLGPTIVWLMPVNTIGERNRKGPLGSPYAVRDYYSVNPEFGTLADLQHFVATAHDLGLRVILDWVANHTAWDSVLVEEHPEWFARDWKGDFSPTPWWDWDDIIDLDYRHEDLRAYMAEAMAHWVREADIDGFRCDVAGFVPTDFWEQARARLEEIKPIFLLAEWETRDLHARAFDATYGWSWNTVMHEIAMGRATVDQLRVYYAWNDRAWPRDVIRMLFVSNHDKNSWEGTEYEQFGPMLDAAIVLSVISEGMPLIYNGQEAGNDKRLEFFERDPIRWQDHAMADRYRDLFALKTRMSSLWNAAWGARMVNVPNDAQDAVISFVRANEDDGVFGIFNLSPERRTVSFGDGPHLGRWADHFAPGPETTMTPQTTVDLPAWGYRLLVR